MVRFRSAWISSIAFAACMHGPIEAATTTTVVDLPVQGGTQRFLYVRPDTPVATIVWLTGGSGVIGIQSDGSLPAAGEQCDPVTRNRNILAARGIASALVDATSNGRVRQYADVHEVIRYVRDHSTAATWMMGWSAATTATANITADSPTGEIQGVIFFAPFDVPPRADLIKVPALLMYHTSDTISAPFEDPLFSALTAASPRERVVFSGGDGGACGYHAISGFDTEIVDALTKFIGTNSPPSVAPGVAAAIEYYHADFRHYFITAIADEITKLDNGTFTGWTRTGQAFNVSTAAGSGRVPVCRFFTLAFPPTSSHFYAPRGLGCEGTLANVNWQFEGEVFFAALPDAAGACSPGYVPVYRLYNNGQGGAPNHRFTTSRQIQADMLAAGYVAEGTGVGVGMCSPQ